MKYSPKCTGRKAACDLGNQYKSKKCLIKILTLNNDPNNCAMKRIQEALLSYNHRIKLKKTNRENLLDFCSCVLEILVRSNT